MTDLDSPSEKVENPSRRTDVSLDPQSERLRALRAAWKVLAPSVLSGRALETSKAGRAIADRLNAHRRDASDASDEERRELDRRLDGIEDAIRSAAANIPIPQLCATLRTHLDVNRSALLDLVDTLIGRDLARFETATGRIGAIDFLITLLCTDSGSPSGPIRHDPVSLTSRVRTLCERAEELSLDLFTNVEAEFFAAATMDAGNLHEEIHLRTLRSRKAELGIAFFVPRILRAVVTYNAILLDRVAAESLDSGDWGIVADSDIVEPAIPDPVVSVFASAPLKRLALEVRGRASGNRRQGDAGDPIAGIAWALDFEYLTKNERSALTQTALGTSRDPLGTVILVGLICRSLAVLSVELEAIGISPDEVSDHWTPELCELVQEQINESISGDAYKIACALSELKNKFLSASLSDHLREQRETKKLDRPHDPGFDARHQSGAEKRSSARDLINDALEQRHYGDSEKSIVKLWTSLPWARISQATFATILVVIAGNIFLNANGDLDAWTREELEIVSPYLTKGSRNQSGAGPAFVGRIDEDWRSLAKVERLEAANLLVLRLRELGLNQIMIYDRKGELRIQALGTQATRSL